MSTTFFDISARSPSQTFLLCDCDPISKAIFLCGLTMGITLMVNYDFKTLLSIVNLNRNVCLMILIQHILKI